MDENQNQEFDEIRPAPPRRRRKRSKWQNFKEAYLPALIAAAALILVICFIAGAFSRASDSKKTDPKETTSPTLSAAELLRQEQDQLLADAEILASQYDYEGAKNLLSTYSAGINSNPVLVAKYNEYEQAASQLVPYSDISAIPQLSFRMLIADLPRALADDTYSDSLNNYYITTSEFSAILQQLYDGGYMLISPYDIAPSVTDANGKVTVTQGTVYLPPDKKPIILTQMGTNFFTYLVDSDGDGKADKGGSGLPSRLVLDSAGNLTAEMVDAEGNTVTGSFDFVTILNDFVAAHPDFSYRGAKAILAVTGYDGLFGYRVGSKALSQVGAEFREAQRQEVVPIIDKIRADGYDIACMTYDYMDYAAKSNAEMIADLNDWSEDIKPLLGDVDIMVFPYDDIGDRNLYNGEKFRTLSEYGFRYFIAKDTPSGPWGQLTETYARMMCKEVGGRNLSRNAEWYKDFFDAAAVLQPERSFE